MGQGVEEDGGLTWVFYVYT